MIIEDDLIKLTDTEIIIDQKNNDIYIDYKILNLKIEEAFNKSKILQQIFEKNIYFKFNGDYYKTTTIEDVNKAYELQKQIHTENHINKVFENATNRLTETNVNLTLKEVYREVINNENYKEYLKIYNQKQFSNKLYRIYRENHNKENIELSKPNIEIPKLKIKVDN